MPPVFVDVYAVPTGGAIGIEFSTAPSGTISLARAVSGGAFSTLYSGAPLASGGVNQFFLDYGDGLPAPLASGTTYVYQLADVGGTVFSAGIQTNGAFALLSDSVTQTLVRLLQAAVANNVPPAGVQPARVIQAMPLTGLPPMPCVVVTPELLQQAEQKVGQDVEQPDATNTWTMSEFALRLYRVSIISTSAVERDYYRNLVIAAFKISLAYVFGPIGENVTHTYQAASYQVVDPHAGQTPGFYGCDVMLELTGTFNLAITTDYGIIATITAEASGGIDGGAGGAVVSVRVPP